MKKYKVIWEEKRSVVVLADNKEEAIEKVNEEVDIIADNGAEISSDFEVEEIKE